MSNKQEQKRNSILDTLQEIKKVSIRDIILYLFLSILSISFYYLDQILTQEREKYVTIIEGIKEFNARMLFETQFSLDNVIFDNVIHQKLQELRTKTNASWVHLWGFHNGKDVGFLHIQRMSVIDEAVGATSRRLSMEWQDINVNLFSGTILEMWQSNNTPLIKHMNDIHDRNYRLHLSEVGIEKHILVPIYIETFNYPIGFLTVSFRHDRFDESKRKEILELLLDTKDIVEYEFLKRHEDVISKRLELVR